jgi:hypothetical protein
LGGCHTLLVSYLIQLVVQVIYSLLLLRRVCFQIVILVIQF